MNTEIRFRWEQLLNYLYPDSKTGIFKPLLNCKIKYGNEYIIQCEITSDNQNVTVTLGTLPYGTVNQYCDYVLLSDLPGKIVVEQEIIKEI